MFVAIDKVTAVRMYNYIKEEWSQYVNEERKNIGRIDDLQEKLKRERSLKWVEETEINVVLSNEQN